MDSVTSVSYLAPRKLPLPSAPGGWDDNRLTCAHPQVPGARPCASLCSGTRSGKRKLPMQGLGNMPRTGPQGLWRLLPCLDALPRVPLGSDWGAWGYDIYLLSRAHAPHTHCVPLQPGHAPLAESQFSTLPPTSTPAQPLEVGGPVPEPTPPSTVQPGATPGNSPGRSTFHLGLFWSMRTDQSGSWPPGRAWLPGSSSLQPGDR